ncbi:MAG: hypothetical protein AAF561_07765 [Planctomycetota bacterium]
MTLLHRLTLATLTFVVLLTSQVGGALFLDWRVEDNFNRLDIDGIEEDVAIAGFSVPGGLFFSHESAGVKLRGLDDASRSGARLVAIPVHSRAGMPDETGHPHVSRPVRLYRLRTVEERSTPLSRFEATGDGVFEGFVDLPETFGVYVLAIERADGSRRWLSSIARVMEPTAPAGDVPHGMAMASFLGHPRTLNPDRVDEHVEIFRRLGIRFVRLGIRWVDVERRQGQRDWDKYDRAFEAYKRAGIDVVVTTYVHPHWTLPFDTPTPSARSAKKPDSVAHPDFDAEYEAFIAEMVRRYRHPGGPGGLWGVEVWNEPWEGGSISMYNADMLRYRELCLATERAVDHEHGIQVPLGWRHVGGAGVRLSHRPLHDASEWLQRHVVREAWHSVWLHRRLGCYKRGAESPGPFPEALLRRGVHVALGRAQADGEPREHAR